MNFLTIFYILILILVYVDSEPTTKTMIIPTTTSTTTTKTSTTITSTNTPKYQKIYQYASPIVTWIFIGIIGLIIITWIECIIFSNHAYIRGKHPITVFILFITLAPLLFIPQALYFLIIKPFYLFIVNKIKSQVQIHIEQNDNPIFEIHHNNQEED